MEENVRERAAVIMAALAHPTRLRIVELLVLGERTVNEIAGALGLRQTGASQHLAVLSRAGILVAEQRGSSRFYRLRGPRVGRIMALIDEFCEVHGLRGGEGMLEAEEPADRGEVAPTTVAPSGR